MKRLILSLTLLASFLLQGAFAQTATERIYLSGTGPDDAVEWDFFMGYGMRSGEWTKIPVPSNWELQGFGSYNYGMVRRNNPREKGLYKRDFDFNPAWKDRRVRLVFEGSMTDTEVIVNGESAGPIHQGAFYRFHYDITNLLKEGSNLLEVNVSKSSTNNTVQEAERRGDYWVFGGIFRPVYLEILPQEFIEWCSVDAAADGNFILDVYCAHIDKANKITGQITDADGNPVGPLMTVDLKKGEEMSRLTSTISNPKLWTAETPNLYHVNLQLMNGNTVVHTDKRRFGFRTFEWREGEGLFVNGSRVLMKGVNRHSFRPDTGRALTRQDCYDDAKLIKSMNMNAVRMSHYPPDVAFLEACDELGLYVINELAGWSRPAYDTPTAQRLVAQMVKRDQMHPSIFMWANGNEGGWNNDVDDDFAIYDLQNRMVAHPWKEFRGVNTKHYSNYRWHSRFSGQKSPLYMPTEILHGLYDGGHGAALNDYWQVTRNSAVSCGFFLWVFADEGVVRTDKDGFIDVDGNNAPDGILGPYHEKEGSYYTIKQIWSPVQILTEEITDSFTGTLEVENTYDFRNLDTCTFRWELVKAGDPTGKDSQAVANGTVKAPSAAPREKATLPLGLPANWRDADVLQVTPVDAEGNDLFTWSWSIQKPVKHLEQLISPRKKEAVAVKEEGGMIIASTGDWVVSINKSTGLLAEIKRGGKALGLSNGPRVVHGVPEGKEAGAPEVNVQQAQDGVVITVKNPGKGLDQLEWTILSSGTLRMKCVYTAKGKFDAHGVTFDLPEQMVKHKRWLGDGPYRVWKNRMHGTQFGVWANDYNESIPGKAWIYPEFKGYFSNVHWMRLDTDAGPLMAATDQENLFVRVFNPPDGEKPVHTALNGFEGDLSFLHAIPGIGTKTIPAHGMGPSGEPTDTDGTYEISVVFW